MMIACTVLCLLACLPAGLRGQETVDCSEIEGAVQVGDRCECTPDHVLSSDWTRCLNVSYEGPGAACQDSAQCVARLQAGAACEGGTCRCVEGFHYLHGRCWRDHGYGDNCSRHENCYASSDADSMVCREDKVCACGLYTYQPHSEFCRRRAQIGEECDLDLDCGDGAGCSAGTYTCESTTTGPETTTTGPETSTPGPETTTTGPETSTPGPETTTTGPETSTPGPETTTTGPETSTPGPETTTTGPETTTPGPETTTTGPETTTTGPETSTPGPGTTTTGPETSTPGPETTTTGPETSTPGPETTTPGQGTVTPDPETNPSCTACSGQHMQCTEGGQCVCEPGFFRQQDGAACLAELGEPCTEDRDCSHMENGTCRRSASTGGRLCGCDGGFAVSASNRACVKTRKFGFNCVEDAQCGYYGGVCVSKKCACPEGSRHVSGAFSCWPARALGETCEVDEDCYVASETGAKCEDNVCVCGQGFHTTSTKDCWKIASELGDHCEEVAQCGFGNTGEGVVCTGNKCSCAPGYMQGNSTSCVVGAGGPCRTDAGCVAVPGAECLDAACRCPERWLLSADDTSCLAIAVEYGDSCAEHAQCTQLLGKLGLCVEGACVCAQGSHERNNTCWETRGLEEDCTYGSQCLLAKSPDLVQCRNGQCRCAFGYQGLPAEARCEPEYSGGQRAVFTLLSVTMWVLLARLV